MKRVLFKIPTVCLLLLLLRGNGTATDTYDYKSGEFLIIKNGESPDKKLAIVSGENKAGEFGVYLMDARTKKLLGPLEEVATDLDSAPQAYSAHWSPDSKHLGITSRQDRHWAVNVIYRLENRRAHVLETPQLICHAVPEFCRLQKELGGAVTLDREDYYDTPWKVRQNESASEIMKWISPTRFVVSEESQWQVKARDPSTTLRSYGKVEKEENESDDVAALYHVWFSAEGECELLPGDKVRVVSTRPVKE